MIKKLLLIAAAAVGGIYITSEEGKDTRESLLKKKSVFEPIVKDLLKQTNEILEGTKSIDSKEVKANIDMLINEAKLTLVELDLDKTAEVIKEAIRVSSKQIRTAINESEKELKLEGKKKMISKPKTNLNSKKTVVLKKTTNTKKATKKSPVKKVPKKAATKKPKK